ncbi:hypothetical protein DRQ05_05000 [bacterium]|nr:MAG: hypothetical protein DRQ05_05000 [bacterium]
MMSKRGFRASEAQEVGRFGMLRNAMIRRQPIARTNEAQAAGRFGMLRNAMIRRQPIARANKAQAAGRFGAVVIMWIDRMI